MRRLSVLFAVALVGGAGCALARAAGEKEEGFVPIFNGKDLSGWEGNKKLWTARDGVLIGRSPGIRHNDFLATTKEYGDFILRFQIRLKPNSANSGVQFRSTRVPNSHEVAGYQADVGGAWWSKLYDEARRGKGLAGPKPDVIKKVLKPEDWNAYEIKAVGPRVTLKINGTTTVEYTEPEPAAKIARSGVIAVQIHGGGPMEVQFKNIRIKELK